MGFVSRIILINPSPAKLKEIKSKAQQNTLRKAEITSDQLRRRYTVLHPSGDQVAPTNILQVSRWFSKQKEEFKSIVYKEEPLTWLKHLLDKRSSSHPRSRWQLSALIMEEYEKSKAQPDGMETIPEGVAVEGARTKVSPPSSIGQQLGNRSPSTGSRSWTSPRHSIEPSLSRRRATADGLVSFEPLVDSGRDSIADVRISEDFPLKGRAYSPQDGANSPRSSIHSGILNSNWPSAPSSSSRLQFRELAQRLRRKPYAASDEALSSERNSVSEQSLDEDGPLSRTAAKARANRLIRAHSPSAFISDEERKLPLNPPEIGDAALSSGGEGPATAKQGVSPYTSRPAQPNQANLKVPGRLVARLSTPNLTSKRSLMSSPYPLTSKERDRYRFQEDEERERKDYERKAQYVIRLLSRFTLIFLQAFGGCRRSKCPHSSSFASCWYQYPRIRRRPIGSF